MNYNVFEYMKAYNDNIDIINAYLKNETIERFDFPSGPNPSFPNFPSGPGPNPSFPILTPDMQDQAGSIMGWSIGIFLVIFLLVLITYIVAIYMLIANWSKLPDWAKVTGLICLFLGLSIGTIVIVVVTRDDKLDNASNKSKVLKKI